MEALDHPVRLGMVGGRHYGLYSPCSSQLLENFRAKLGAAIGSDGGWYAEGLDPAKRESINDALGCNVCEGDCDGPSGEPIHHGQ